MFRNKEIRIFLILSLVITVIATYLGFAINDQAGKLVLLICILLILVELFFTFWRYKKIKRLSDYLNKLASGQKDMLMNSSEGELSILQSEIYKLATILLDQAEALKKDKNYLSDSLSDISHQLKTPLTSISMMTDLLTQENISNEKRLEFIKNIRTSLNRTEWLVAALLKLSRLDAGVIEFKNETVNLSELVEAATAPLLIPIELREQTLEIDGDHLITIKGDHHWLVEAISNIIKNAVEHTPEKGIIRISFEKNPMNVRLIISDTGNGIEKVDLARIFERFYRGKHLSKSSVGIGLSLSKMILSRQKASVDVESEIGEGTRFNIKFYDF